MRILHTSDWHVGRTFHSHSTIENLQVVFDELVAIVEREKVDVLLVSGDIFDSSTPAGEFVQVLDDTIVRLLSAGVQIVMTSGNHDSAKRLGFQSGPAAFGGIHVVTRAEDSWRPIELRAKSNPDESVVFYGIPYLSPALVNGFGTDQKFASHEQVLTFVMERINANRAEHGRPSVVLAHCFASGQAGTTDTGDGKIEQYENAADITVGGLGIVPLPVFDGPDYVALGHIHGRHTLSERARYSGAPLHYSFGERGKPRGAWLFELTDAGLGDVHWVDLPVPRELSEITGTIDDLLTKAEFGAAESHWVKAIATDQVMPTDAVRRLHTRFPYVVDYAWRPEVVAEARGANYGERVAGKTDAQIIDAFVSHVRNGVEPSPDETSEIGSVLQTLAEKVTD